jgi:hypothetical protein
MTKQSRVYWLIDETEKVLRAYHAMKLSNTLPSRAELSWKKAQEVLPINRRRSFASPSAAALMNAKYRTYLNRGFFNSEPKPDVIQTPQSTPELKAMHVDGFGMMTVSSYEAAVAHHKKYNPTPRPTLDEVFGRLIDDRLNHVLGAVIPEIFSKIDEKLVHQNTVTRAAIDLNYERFMTFLDPKWAERKEAQVSTPAPTAPPASHKPVIVLVNADVPQTQSVQREFPQFDIRLVRDKVPAEHCPLLVVAFTKFMDGALDRQCEKKFADSYLKVPPSGAASEAKIQIRRRLAHLLHDGQ